MILKQINVSEQNKGILCICQVDMEMALTF